MERYTDWKIERKKDRKTERKRDWEKELTKSIILLSRLTWTSNKKSGSTCGARSHLQPNEVRNDDNDSDSAFSVNLLWSIDGKRTNSRKIQLKEIGTQQKFRVLYF